MKRPCMAVQGCAGIGLLKLARIASQKQLLPALASHKGSTWYADVSNVLRDELGAMREICLMLPALNLLTGHSVHLVVGNAPKCNESLRLRG
eukprot:2276314-Amphidinium_carterae.1